MHSPNRKIRSICLVLTSVLAFAATGVPAHAGGDKKKVPDIYDTKADGAKQIEAALKIAKRDHKRVLLQFGANWCPWCHHMHDILTKDKEIAHTMLYEYVLVLIDLDKVDGKMHNIDINDKYGDPKQFGLPAWVVLDENGKQVATVNTEPFEVGEDYDHAKIHAALKKYRADPVSAEAIMSSALARAKKESKKIFVNFSAPWCSWCKKFDAYFEREDVARIFNSAYVHLKIDVERMTSGEEVAEKYGKKEDQGIPFFAVVDANGKKLYDSVGPKGNCGFPVEDFEVAHYMDVLSKTSGLPSAKLNTLKNALALKD